MLRDWMSNAATDGWCADMTISVQHLCEDHEDDTVHSEHHENLANTLGGATLSQTTLIPRQVTVCLPISERCGVL